MGRTPVAPHLDPERAEKRDRGAGRGCRTRIGGRGRTADDEIRIFIGGGDLCEVHIGAADLDEMTGGTP